MSAPEFHKTKSRRVLVVDDNLDHMQALALLLRHMGHSVEFSITGEAGLEAARRIRPEFVFLDLNLPGISGFDVAKALLGVHGGARPRVIAITGNSSEEFRERSLQAGCEMHLVKPVDPVFLLRVLDGDARE